MLNIGLVLPDVLGTYGDDGNALVLRQRARMRGLQAEIHPIRLGEPVPETLDIYTLGGGEDTAQILAADHLISDGGLTRAANAGRPVFAICAGLQVLGESFRASGRIVDGVGLLDATTAGMQDRAIGEVASEPTRAGVTADLTEPLTGFANLGSLGILLGGLGGLAPERRGTHAAQHLRPLDGRTMTVLRRLRAAEVPVYSFDREFLAQAAARLQRRSKLALTVTERQIYLDIDGHDLSTPIDTAAASG